MDLLEKELLAELECVICLEYMRPPILLCVNGHNICKSCKPKLNNRCPTCKGALSSLRNRTVENLASKVKYPCKHNKSGCRAEVSYETLEKHESTCPFQHYKCPFTFGGNVCSWDGPVSEMKTHICSLHAISVFQVSGKRKILRKITFLPEHRWLEAVFTLNEIFISCSVIADGVLYHRVVCVGPMEKSRQYKYKICMVTVSGTEEDAEWKQMCSYKTFMTKIVGKFEYLDVFFKDGNYFTYSLHAVDRYMNAEKCIELREDIERIS